MFVQFLLFVIAMLLLSIFWVLSKINSNLKKNAAGQGARDYKAGKKEFRHSSV